MPQGVYTAQALAAFVVIVVAVAVRVLAPRLALLPRAGAKLPLEYVVCKLVALLGGKTAEPGTHIAYHIVNVPAAENYLVG